MLNRIVAIAAVAMLGACASPPAYIAAGRVDCSRIDTITAELVRRENLGWGLSFATAGAVGTVALAPQIAIPAIGAATVAGMAWNPKPSSADLREERAYLVAACRQTLVAQR